MPLGNRGKDRINGKTVDALFTPTETVAGSSEEISEKKIGRPKGGRQSQKLSLFP